MVSIPYASGRRGRRFKSCRIDSWQGHPGNVEKSRLPGVFLFTANGRGGRGRRVHEVLWTSGLDRPERSGESNPVASTPYRGSRESFKIRGFRQFSLPEKRARQVENRQDHWYTDRKRGERKVLWREIYSKKLFRFLRQK